MTFAESLEIDPDFAFVTSSAVIRPLGPEPVTTSSEIPSAAASLRVLGLASGRTFVARAGVEVCLEVCFVSLTGAAACDAMSFETFPVASICIKLDPTANTSPTFAPRDLTIPVTGAGISICDLSVSTTTTG